MTTMHDVAAAAGVSAKTVSRVFNDDPHVSPDTRQRVQDAMRALNYVPNMLGKTFRTGRSPVIGIAVPDLADPFFSALAKEVELAARERDMAIVVTSLGGDPSLEQRIVETTVRHQVAGLIIAPISADQSYLERWSETFPLVFVDRAPRRLNADSFVEDDRGGAIEATRHLVAHGHRRIAFIGDTTDLQTTALRLDGYRQALEAEGIPEDESLVVLGVADAAAAAEACRDLLSRAEPPTAVFSSNARFSIGIYPVFQAMGRADVAFISYGDFPMADALKPTVTVIDQDPKNLARLAAERLFARLDSPGRRFRRRNVVPVRLIERESCLVGSSAPQSQPGGADSRPAAALG